MITYYDPRIEDDREEELEHVVWCQRDAAFMYKQIAARRELPDPDSSLNRWLITQWQEAAAYSAYAARRLLTKGATE